MHTMNRRPATLIKSVGDTLIKIFFFEKRVLEVFLMH